jgi:hypothetical protein
MRGLGIGAALAVAVAAVATARADGELTVRGAYYKERATRVEQPMLDGRFDVGEAGSLDAHLLVDSISSASVVAFDEKRVEAGAGYAHVVGDYTVGGSARYSSEPDYKSAFGTLRAQAEAFDKNSRWLLGAGHDDSNAGAGHGRISARCPAGAASAAQRSTRTLSPPWSTTSATSTATSRTRTAAWSSPAG